MVGESITGGVERRKGNGECYRTIKQKGAHYRRINQSKREFGLDRLITCFPLMVEVFCRLP